MSTAVATPDLIRAARQSGLALIVDGDALVLRGPAPACATWREILVEHKPAILEALAAESLPPDVEARLARLLAVGYIDQSEADQVRAGWHRYLTEWEFLLTCCESAAGITAPGGSGQETAADGGNDTATA